MSKILYAGIVLDSNWTGGEPVVAKSLISYLQSHNWELFKSYYKPISYFKKKLSPLMREYVSVSDKNKSAVEFYLNEIKKVNPDIIISQYDFDTSIIEAAKISGKKIISYIHIWWPTCPKITNYKNNDSICDGYIGNDCYSCVMNNLRGKSKYFLKIMANENNIKRKMDQRIKRLNYDNVYIIVLNNEMKNYFSNYIKKEHIFVVNNGINLEEFTYYESKREKVVSYFGGQSEGKGYRTFLKAAEILHEQMPEIKLFAAGSFDDDLINKYPYINFLGLIDRRQVVELLQKSRCTIFPASWKEPFSLIVLESSACGTPVVASGIDTFKEMFKDGEDIFIAIREDAKDFASKIKMILNDDILFEKVSKNARKKVETLFDQQNTYKNFEILLKKIIES